MCSLLREKIQRKFVKRDILHKNIVVEYDILHKQSLFNTIICRDMKEHHLQVEHRLRPHIHQQVEDAEVG